MDNGNIIVGGFVRGEEIWVREWPDGRFWDAYSGGSCAGGWVGGGGSVGGKHVADSSISHKC